MKAKKLKTYVITVSRYFPSTHPRKGEETGFVDAIGNGSKIHTIRGNYELWAKRIAKVQAGEAVLSLRYWEGRPYFSNQIEFQQLSKANGVGIQELVFWTGQPHQPEIVDLGENWTQNYVKLAKNDGLSPTNYEAWFETGGYDLSGSFALIHFTPFRY